MKEYKGYKKPKPTKDSTRERVPNELRCCLKNDYERSLKPKFKEQLKSDKTH